MKKLSQIIEASRWDKDQPSKLDGLHNNLMKHYNDYDEYHEGAIKDYTKDSESLNSYHWERRNDNVPKDTYMQNKTLDMDNAVDQHRTPHKLSVYSGVKTNIKDKMDSNLTLNHPAYISTSLNKHSANFFAHPIYNENNGKSENHILKINVPKDHPGAYVDHKSDNEGEKEFILPRNTQLKYKGSTTYKKEDTGLSRDIVEHNMDII